MWGYVVSFGDNLACQVRKQFQSGRQLSGEAARSDNREADTVVCHAPRRQQLGQDLVCNSAPRPGWAWRAGQIRVLTTLFISHYVALISVIYRLIRLVAFRGTGSPSKRGRLDRPGAEKESNISGKQLLINSRICGVMHQLWFYRRQAVTSKKSHTL